MYDDGKNRNSIKIIKFGAASGAGKMSFHLRKGDKCGDNDPPSNDFLHK